jgi:hypothetical protein
MKLYNTVKVINKRYNGEKGLISKIFPAGELADKEIYEVKFSGNNNSGQFTREELIEMNTYSHVYLYAKHWYKRTDIVADMKILIGNRCGIAPGFISTENCVEQLVDLVYLSITRSGNPIHFFSEFVLDITLRKNRWKFNGESDDSDEVVIIKKCLSVLALTDTKNIDGEFAEPDQKILPLANEDGLKRFRDLKKEVTRIDSRN